MAVTYKGDVIVGTQFQIILAFDDNGELNQEGSQIITHPARCLGGQDGKVQMNPTFLQASAVSQEAIQQLQSALLAIFEDPDHLKLLSYEPRLAGENLFVDGVEFKPEEVENAE